jgi:lipopolysaccharide transport system permease protein
MDLPTTKNAGAFRTVGAARNAADARPPRAPVPEEPLVVIEPGNRWAALDLRDLWTYRELLYFLVWRDLKVRYKQAVFGLGWAIMQPLLLTLIFTVFLGRLARVPSDDLPYALFVNAGLVPWTYFSNAVVGSGNSLVGSSHLITKVYFPRVIIPAAAVGARLVDSAVAFVILGGLMAYYAVAPTWNILLLPALVGLLTLLALGVGMWISALNVKYRDVGVVLPVLIQVWMFASPVVYPSGLVGDWRWAYSLNPVAGIIEGFRASLFGRAFDWPSLAAAAAVTLALLVSSLYVFRRMEKSFADLV